MAENQNVAGKPGVLLAVIIIAIAVSIVVWQAFDVNGWAVPFIILMIVGLFLLISSFFMPRKSRIGPSPSSYYLVNGTALSMIGIIGTLNLATDLEWWYSVVACLVVVALLILWITFSRD